MGSHLHFKENILTGKTTVKPVLGSQSKRIPKIGFQDLLLLYASQKYYRMLPLEHSVILLTFIKLPFVIKIFVLSSFKGLLETGFTVLYVNALSKIEWLAGSIQSKCFAYQFFM